MRAEVTRPEGAKVTLTVAVPEGPSPLQEAAFPAAPLMAERAASALNSAAEGGGGGGGALGASVVAGGGTVAAVVAAGLPVPAPALGSFEAVP